MKLLTAILAILAVLVMAGCDTFNGAAVRCTKDPVTQQLNCQLTELDVSTGLPLQNEIPVLKELQYTRTKTVPPFAPVAVTQPYVAPVPIKTIEK